MPSSKKKQVEVVWSVERIDEDWVRMCMYIEVEGARPRGRSRKTW